MWKEIQRSLYSNGEYAWCPEQSGIEPILVASIVHRGRSWIVTGDNQLGETKVYRVGKTRVLEVLA